MSAIEISMNTPGTLQIIGEVSKKLKNKNDVILGAGSVLDPETARACILNGAQFIVSSCTNPDVTRLSHSG